MYLKINRQKPISNISNISNNAYWTYKILTGTSYVICLRYFQITCTCTFTFSQNLDCKLFSQNTNKMFQVPTWSTQQADRYQEFTYTRRNWPRTCNYISYIYFWIRRDKFPCVALHAQVVQWLWNRVRSYMIDCWSMSFIIKKSHKLCSIQ